MTRDENKISTQTLAEWRKQHQAECAKQPGMTLNVEGKQVTLCAGFTENSWGTVGVPYDDCSSACNGCGAWWKGRVYRSKSAEQRARKRGEFVHPRTGGGQ